MDEQVEQVVPTEVAEVKEEVTEAPVEEKVEEPEPPTPKKKTAQERIDEITKARREAEREKEYWKQVALDKAKETPKPVQEPTIRNPRPTISQFDTTEAYEDALLDWRDRVKEEQSAEQRRVKEQEEGLSKFQKAAAKAREQYADFDEVVESPVFSPQMRYAILNSDTGPELAYFLGSPENYDTALKIQSLSPDKQYYEMGKLETRLALAQKTKKVPSAPPPISPVGMSGTGGEVDPSKMTIEEWMKWDKEQALAKLSKRYPGG
jgi:hypothetical protein